MRTNINIDHMLKTLADQLKLDISGEIILSNTSSRVRIVDLRIGNNQVEVPIEIKQELRKMHLAQLQDLKEIHEDYLLLANIIAKPLRQKLRELKINFIDGCGNASINIGDVHIQIDGLKGDRVSDKIRTFRPSHLKLIWFLMQKPEGLNKPYREIAHETGVSLDTISKTLKTLEKQNFIVRLNNAQLLLTNKTTLMEKWLMGFEDALKPKLKTGTYRFSDPKMKNEWQNIHLEEYKILWGGEPGAAKLTQYLIPEIFTIYTNLSEIELLKQYHMVPDSKGNIDVYHLFFKPEIFATGDLVPPLLIYADLQSSGEERNKETAKLIFEKYIAGTLQ